MGRCQIEIGDDQPSSGLMHAAVLVHVHDLHELHFAFEVRQGSWRLLNGDPSNAGLYQHHQCVVCDLQCSYHIFCGSTEVC